MQKRLKLIVALFLVVIAFAAAGCGGGGAQRILGLSADGVVQTFFDAAKAGNTNEATLYVSPSTLNDPSTVYQYLTGQNSLSSLKNANLLSLRKVAEQGNFAVVVATLQLQQNSLNVTVKPIGLEKINGEWYIVDNNQIYQDAKYHLLLQLLSN